jgi:hypothetical protein
MPTENLRESGDKAVRSELGVFIPRVSAHLGVNLDYISQATPD